MKTATLSGFRLVRLNPNQVMAIVVISNGLVENKVYTIPGTIDDSDLEKVVRIINDELIGVPLDIVAKRLKDGSSYPYESLHEFHKLQIRQSNSRNDESFRK